MNRAFDSPYYGVKVSAMKDIEGREFMCGKECQTL